MPADASNEASRTTPHCTSNSLALLDRSCFSAGWLGRVLDRHSSAMADLRRLAARERTSTAGRQRVGFPSHLGVRLQVAGVQAKAEDRDVEAA